MPAAPVAWQVFMASLVAKTNSLHVFSHDVTVLPKSHFTLTRLNSTEARGEDRAAARIFRDDSKRPLLFLLLAAAAYLYLNLFSLPAVPFLLGGDQVSFWLRGLRLLDHQRIYQDFYQFTPPGMDLVYFGLFRLLGTHVWVTNLFVLVLGVALCGLTFSIARQIANLQFAALATAFFLVTIYCKLLNGTHHGLSVLCVMIAVRIGMKQTGAPGVLVAGVFLGCASFFTQTRGAAALAAFVLFLAWRQWGTKRSWLAVLKDDGLLVMGFAVGWLLLNAYFIATAGFRLIWYFQVTHVRRYIVHAEGHLLGLPDPLTLHNLPRLAPYLLVYILLVLVYPTALWLSWRIRRRSGVWEPVSLLALVGFFLLMEVASSPNWLRVYAVSLPGFILLAWILYSSKKLPRSTAAMLWLVLFCIAGWQTVSHYAQRRVVAALPGGVVATTPETYTKLHWLMERTKPGDFLFEAAWPGVYLPLQLRNPSYLETVLPFDGPPAEAVRRVPGELESHKVQIVLWSRSLDATPGQTPSSDDYLPQLRRYLHDCYGRVYIFSDGEEAWQRIDRSGCAQERDGLAPGNTP